MKSLLFYVVAGLAALPSAVPGSAGPAAPVPGTVDLSASADGLPAVTPADIVFRDDVLRPGSARRAGLAPEEIAALPGIAASYLRPTPDHPGHPAYAGATVLAAHHG